MPPFHLAIPVSDLEKTREFYIGLLGCTAARASHGWVDFDFFGHQVSAHLKPDECKVANTNKVDGDDVPVRHFGAVLKWQDWEKLAEKLKKYGSKFLIEPRVRFTGQPGEQGTFFIKDPSGNALEFKTFRNPEKLFTTDFIEE